MKEKEYMEMAAQLRKPYGENAPQTADWMNRGNVYINRETILKTLSFPVKNILEIGPGNGLFVEEIFERAPDIQYSACDHSAEMVDLATALNEKFTKDKRASFIHTAMHDLPFSDAHFDAIFTVNTLYFWDEPEKILNEFKRVLKKAGKLVIGFRPKSQMQNHPFTKYGFKLYEKEDAIALIESNNMNIIELNENPEPDFDLNGQIIKMQHCILVAEKL